MTGASDGTLTCSGYSTTDNIITRESLQVVKLRVPIRAIAFVQNVSQTAPLLHPPPPFPLPFITHPVPPTTKQNLAVAFANETVALYTCPELTLVRNLSLPKDRGGAVCALCACRGGRAVAVAEDTGRAYTVGTGGGAARSVRLSCDAAAEDAARPLQFVEDPQRRFLCVLTAAGALHVFAQDAVDAAASGQRVAAHVLPGVGPAADAPDTTTTAAAAASAAVRAAFNAQGTVLAVPGGAGVTLLDVVDAATGAVRAPDEWPRRVLAAAGAVRVCAWSGDGRVLAVCDGARGGAVRLWDVAAGAETGVLGGTGDAAEAVVVDVQWSPVLNVVAVARQSNECVRAAGAAAAAAAGGEPARKKRRRSVLLEPMPAAAPKSATKPPTHTTRAMPLSLDDIVKKKQNAMELMAVDESRKKAEAAAAAEAEAAAAASAAATAVEGGEEGGEDNEEALEGVHIGAPVVDARGKKRVSWARALVAVHEFEKDGFNQCVPKKSREAFLREMEEEKRLMGAQQTLWLDEKDTMAARIAWAAPARVPAALCAAQQHPAATDITEVARLHAANATRMSVRYPDLSYVPASPAEPPAEPPAPAAPVRRGFWVPPPALVQHDRAGHATAVNVDVLQQNMGALLKYMQDKKRLQQQQAPAPATAGPVSAPQDPAPPKAARPLPAFLMGAIRQQQQQQQQPQQPQQPQFMAPQPQPQMQPQPQPQPVMMAGPPPPQVYPQPVPPGYAPGMAFVPQPPPYYAPVAPPYSQPMPQWQPPPQPQPQPYYQPVPGYPPPPPAMYPQWR